MRQICKIVAGFEHCRVHQRGERRVVTALQGLRGDLDIFGLDEKHSVSFVIPNGERQWHH
jgi:hypothetical protein